MRDPESQPKVPRERNRCCYNTCLGLFFNPSKLGYFMSLVDCLQRTLDFTRGFRYPRVPDCAGIVPGSYQRRRPFRRQVKILHCGFRLLVVTLSSSLTTSHLDTLGMEVPEDPPKDSFCLFERGRSGHPFLGKRPNTVPP